MKIRTQITQILKIYAFDYYERKVAQGKRKMSVLNAVKAKLLHRVMSVVQRKEKYENSVNFSLVLS
jgi:transposase